MTAGIEMKDWAAHHGLTDDMGAPLAVSFNRIRTSVEARRTRQMGGHLPSAARSNTVPVLFGNYLRDDPATVEWAHEVMADALVDAEQTALDVHRRRSERQAAPRSSQTPPGRRLARPRGPGPAAGTPTTIR